MMGACQAFGEALGLYSMASLKEMAAWQGERGSIFIYFPALKSSKESACSTFLLHYHGRAAR